jgi:hypothetical protein
MSKFKVGDKVVFNRENAKSDIDRLVPGTDSWLDSVPKGPLTIKEVGIATMQVEECHFLFSPDWFDKYEEPERVGKFKVGDKVYVRPDVETGVSPRYLDYDRAYTIINKWRSGSFVLDGGLEPFGFTEEWLLPAKGEVKKEAKLEVKISEGRIKDVKFSGPATIVFWTDGTKTVVKCRKGDKFDPEKGIAMACAKKLLGNEDGYHKEIAKYTKTAKKDESALMDTEKLRSFVLKTCLSFVGCTDCPCRIANGGRCFIVATADREQLSIMYKQFLYAGKLRKEGLKNG